MHTVVQARGLHINHQGHRRDDNLRACVPFYKYEN